MKNIKNLSHRARYKYYNEMWLSYVNDFITVNRFAEYYELEPSIARLILDAGEMVNNHQDIFLKD